MEKYYYYPISSTSLAAIFGQACILPASLYENRLPDIQNKFENFIFLTKNFGCLESDCCLQIILTLEEEKSLVDINGGFYLFESAIPITRIKKIYFKKRNQAYRTISNITLSTAFIPSDLIDEKDNTFEKTSDIVHVPEDIVSSVDNIKASYDKYNRILGAMALMKTAHDEGCNFSAHYIDLLSKFNSYIESQKRKIAVIDAKFNRVFETHPAFLDKKVTFEILESEARECSQTISKDKLTKVIIPDNLDKNVYVCYVLYDYGVGEESHRHRIDELILNNFTGLKQGYEESCALYYGYNRGYASFNNQYRKEGKTENVKFQLNSLLDYYTIESIYRYCFNKEVSSKFDLFDSWVKTLPSKKAKKGEYLILDTLVCDKKKAIFLSEEWWKTICSSFLSKDRLSFLGSNFLPVFIVDKILKPFVTLVKNEISREYEEEIQKLKDTNEALKKKLSYMENEDKKVTIKGNSVTPSLSVNNQTHMFNEEEFMKRCYDLDDMTMKELKAMAKEIGCSVKGKTKKIQLIFEIVRAEKTPR